MLGQTCYIIGHFFQIASLNSQYRIHVHVCTEIVFNLIFTISRCLGHRRMRQSWITSKLANVFAYAPSHSLEATATFSVATFNGCTSQVQLENFTKSSSLSSEFIVSISSSRYMYTGSLNTIGLCCHWGVSADLSLLTQVVLTISKLLISWIVKESFNEAGKFVMNLSDHWHRLK